MPLSSEFKRHSSALLAIKITVKIGAGKSLTRPNTDLFCCICLSNHGNDKIGLSFFAKHLLFSMVSAS